MLTCKEQEMVLSEFPNIKLSYENIMHNKVYNADVFLAIPEGKKCFAWFTYYNDKASCLILELSENKIIANIKIFNAIFSDTLAYGTILYGTRFYYSNNNFFNIEDIFYYKGTNVSTNNWGSKFILFKKLMDSDIKQTSHNNSFIVFGLPLLSSNLNELLTCIKGLNYKISKIQLRLHSKKNVSLFKNVNNIIQDISNQKQLYTNKSNNYNTKRNIVFNVKPDITNDIYHLYCENNGKNEYYAIALIPDFKTSVMMNSLFRNIKENINLDALEESDDEEEFENNSENRFVDLEKSHKMICKYNYKFKKWVPINIVNDKESVISVHEINQRF